MDRFTDGNSAKTFLIIQLLQFLIPFALGLSVDLSNLLFGFIQPDAYFWRVIMLVFGFKVMGFAVFLLLKVDAVFNPAEGIVAVIKVKTAFDITLVILSVILSLIFAGKITGIREGMILSALLIDPFIGYLQRVFDQTQKENKK